MCVNEMWKDPLMGKIRNHMSKYKTPEHISRAHVEKVLSCEVCGTYEDIDTDHCHEYEKYRGALCGACNSALGFMKENARNIQRLARYAQLCQLLKDHWQDIQE